MRAWSEANSTLAIQPTEKRDFIMLFLDIVFFFMLSLASIQNTSEKMFQVMINYLMF